MSVTPATRGTAGEQRHLTRMARAGGLSLIGAAFAAVSGLVLTLLLTNGLSQSDAGTVFAVTSLFLIAVGVVQLGTDVGLVRWMPQLLVQGQRERVRVFVGAALGPVLLLSVVTSIGGVLFAADLARVVAPRADAAELAQQITVLAVALPVAAVYKVHLSASRGLRTMVPTVVVDSFGRALAQLATVALALGLGLGVGTVVAAWAVPYAVAAPVAWLWVRGLLGADGQRSVATPRHDWAAFALFWRYTGPRALGTAVQAALKRSDIILVAALRSPREAALYAAATRFVVLGQLGVQALQQALSPLISSLFAREDHANARAVYRATTAWAMLLGWPVYLSTAVLAPDVLDIFGPGYDAAAGTVVLLSLAMLAATASGAVDTVLLMSGHSWLSLVNNLTALVVNVGLNLVLIPSHGVLGAGISWAVAIVLRNLLPLVQVGWRYRMSPLGSETLLVAAISASTFGLAPGALRLAEAPSGMLWASLGLASVSYAVLVWLLRSRLQLNAFTGALHRRRGGEVR